MGGSESKKTDVRHELLFKDDEKKLLSYVFCTIAHGAKTFKKEQFQHFTHAVLDPFTSSRLFDLIEGPVPHQQHHRFHHHHQSSGEINIQHFASHLGILLKGSVSDLARTCIFIASTSPGIVSASDLIKLVVSVLHSYEKMLSAHCTAYQSWMFAQTKDSHERLAHSLLKDFLHTSGKLEKDGSPKVDLSLSFKEDEVEEWLTSCSFFTEILRQVLLGAFQFYPTEPQLISFFPRVPQVRDTNWSRCKTLLDFPTVLFLNHSLYTQLQTQWKMLFSSNVHGASFSQLVHSISNKGPSYIIVRDKKGHIFGGFASTSWEINPRFTGNSGCFLFQVKPDFRMYTPTGYNGNFMYLNCNVQTLPNGLGMGGQFEYFGLWIDQSFGRGHSKASSRGNTTYGSPPLAYDEEFEVDCIEVWGVGRRQQKEGEEDEDEEEVDEDMSVGTKRSILDKVAAEDKAILDMMNRGTISDAMREEPVYKETANDKKIISPF